MGTHRKAIPDRMCPCRVFQALRRRRYVVSKICRSFLHAHRESSFAGVPFHSMEQRPRAPCPYCKQIKAGSEPQELFALQGPAAGEHDPGIPQAYFDIAPAKLNDMEMEALRVSRKPSRLSSIADVTIVSIRIDATIRFCDRSQTSRSRA